MRAVLLFAFAGGIGYLVGASGLLPSAPWIGPYAGRILSFCAAVVSTWLVNRSLTFADRCSGLPLHREFLRYFILCLGGGSVNVAAYALLVYLFELTDWWLLIGLAVGSLAGMVVNFVLSRQFVFRRQNTPR